VSKSKKTSAPPREKGLAKNMLVEQNARKSLSTMSRGYVLETGRISLEGSSEELKSNPEVQRAYLGI
jgi:branched-chain amino acid transport system ATP-binding protein